MYCIDKDSQLLIWKFTAGGSPAYIPDSYDQFEMRMEIPKGDVEQVTEKRYSFDIGTEDEKTSEYQSRITYQVSTQYAAKGKYQVNSHEEEF